MSLATIAATLEQFAEDVVNDAVAEGKKFLAETVDNAKDFVEAELKVGYADFLDLTNKIGKRATQLVTDLMSDDSLKGIEKANLAATQLVEHAAQNGITVAEQDVTALVKNAYEAVISKVKSL